MSFLFFFFFKQKTAYEIYQCDWSSDVCSSDLVDNDGDLDVFTGRSDSPALQQVETSEIMLNQGDGTFRDATAESGIARAGKGMGSTFADLDLDGDVDLVVVNDRHQNFLYVNDGEGHFTETGVIAEIAFDANGFETGAMGVSTGDVDGDGYPDMLISNMIFEYNALYLNRHDMTFEDATERARMDKPAYETVGWGVILCDFDRDGDLDAFVANGHVQDYIDTFSESIQYAQPNLIFANAGDRKSVV